MTEIARNFGITQNGRVLAVVRMEKKRRDRPPLAARYAAVKASLAPQEKITNQDHLCKV